jgi:hypothetical protein
MEWQTAKKYDKCVISGFHHKVAENCTLLGYCTVSSGNFLPTFQKTYQSHPWGSEILILDSGFLNPEDGTDGLSLNVCKKLPLLTV